MGKRGPKKTPTAILAAAGSARALGRPDEPQSAVRAPEMPVGLPAEAREHWDYIVPLLLNRRTIAPEDVAILVALCVEYAEYMQATRDLDALKQSGKRYKGHLIDHPRVVRKGAFERMNRALSHFGLSPATKAGVYATPEDDEEKEKPAVSGPLLRIAR